MCFVALFNISLHIDLFFFNVLTKYIDSTWWKPEYKIWLEALSGFLSVVHLWSDRPMKSKIHVFMHNKRELKEKRENYKWIFKNEK